jgi:plastocyanin
MWLTRVLITAGLATVMACKSSTSPACSGACVNIQDFSFTPPALMVKAGTMVTWGQQRAVRAHHDK